jgi:hypothetical protein
MIRLETSNFKASLLGLLGESLEQAKATCPGFRIVNENGKAGRIVWREEATDTEEGKKVPLLLIARFIEGTIWAVGIWAEGYLFGLESHPDGRTWFAAGPRPPDAELSAVNWIALEDGKPAEKGFAP